jgi:uncharacterized protein (DUF1330 family)
MPSIWPTEEQLSSINEFDQDQPITMLNLLAYRVAADYHNHPAEIACSGKEAYKRYSDAITPLLTTHGGKVVFVGAANPTVIGPDAEQWDDVMLVEYSTPKAFINMATSPEYAAASIHRSAALSDSRLVPMAAGKTRFQT